MKLGKITQFGVFFGLFSILAFFMVKFEAFEAFFEFTRSHEDWQLDEYVAVTLSALITGVIWFGVDARRKGREIFRISSESLQNERKMSDSRRVQALGTLAGGVAHSGNNLMQPIQTLARLSKGQLAADHPVQGHLDRIITAAHSAGDLFHSILKFSREETELSQSTDIGALIRENKSFFAAAIPMNIQLKLESSPLPCVAQISSNNLLDILLALLSNSVDSYNGESGIVKIESSSSEKSVELRVQDYGCGIEADKLVRIFEPFYTQKDVGAGTGLGLAIVKRLVEDAGGQVHVISKPVKGTTITVRLPVSDQSVSDQSGSDQSDLK